MQAGGVCKWIAADLFGCKRLDGFLSVYRLNEELTVINPQAGPELRL
jgi:hypothetical protein